MCGTKSDAICHGGDPHCTVCLLASYAVTDQLVYAVTVRVDGSARASI